MTLPLATYRPAIKAWVEAQSGCTAQWRDEDGPVQYKPRIRMHLQTSSARGVDWLTWIQDTDLDPGEDYVPTVQGHRALVLSLRCETRDQSGNTTAMYYLERVRSSMRKPSVRAALYAAGLVIENAEAVMDLDGLVENRRESWAHLDVHLAGVVNDRDEAEADSYTDHATVAGTMETPAGADAGPGEDEYP